MTNWKADPKVQEIRRGAVARIEEVATAKRSWVELCAVVSDIHEELCAAVAASGSPPTEEKRDAERWRLVQEWLSIDENEDGDIRLFCEPPYLDLNERCAPEGEMLPREQWPTVVQVVDELAAGIAPALGASGSPPSPEKPSARVLDAINWLMGCNGAFEPSPDQLFRGEVPAYWFRSKFAERARLLYDGERYHFDLPDAVDLFNPESMEHPKVRDLLMDCRVVADAILAAGFRAPRDCPQCQAVQDELRAHAARIGAPRDGASTT